VRWLSRVKRRLDPQLEKIQHLLQSQKLAVLSTCGKDCKPYASLVAFIAAPDLKKILFATSRNTRKFANISANNNVALLVNSSSNRESDFQEAAAVTITGKADVAEDHERDRLIRKYLEKHPCLEDFVKSPSCAIICVQPEFYYLVENFQQVTKLHINPD